MVSLPFSDLVSVQNILKSANFCTSAALYQWEKKFIVDFVAYYGKNAFKIGVALLACHHGVHSSFHSLLSRRYEHAAVTLYSHSTVVTNSMDMSSL